MLAHMSSDDAVGFVIVSRSRKFSNDTDAYNGFRRGMFEHIPDFVKTKFLESVNASGIDHRQRVTLLALRTADPWKRMTNILFHVKKMVENSLNRFQEMMRLINSMYDGKLRSVAMARVESFLQVLKNIVRLTHVLLKFLCCREGISILL